MFGANVRAVTLNGASLIVAEACGAVLAALILSAMAI
jgi:hypothetical protein